MKNTIYSTVNQSLMDLRRSGIDIKNAPIRVYVSEDDYIEITKHETKQGGWIMKDSRMFIDNKGFPHVKPIGLISNSVYIVCPYCKTIHHHGRGGIDKGENSHVGHRGSHCYADNISGIKDYGYYID